MKWRPILALLLVPVFVLPGFAGIFGKKPVKPNPAERVPELLKILKNDGDETKRLEAAEELRQHDPQTFPQIIPALIQSLQSDSKPAVRAEVAQTLGKLRPVSEQVGQALEQARDKDASMRVRLQARSSLLWYYGWTYHSNKKEEAGSNKEPPAEPRGSAVPVIRTQQPQNLPHPPSTAEPPLAPPLQSRSVPEGNKLLPPPPPLPPATFRPMPSRPAGFPSQADEMPTGPKAEAAGSTEKGLQTMPQLQPAPLPQVPTPIQPAPMAPPDAGPPLGWSPESDN